MTFSAPHAYAASWLPRAGGDDEYSVASHGMDAAEREVWLHEYRLHLAQLGRAVEHRQPHAGRVVRAAGVDRLGDPRLFQRHRRIRHHQGAVGDAGEDCLSRRIQVIDHLDAEPVLLQCSDRLGERLVVGKSREAVSAFDLCVRRRASMT